MECLMFFIKNQIIKRILSFLSIGIWLLFLISCQKNHIEDCNCTDCNHSIVISTSTSVPSLVVPSSTPTPTLTSVPLVVSSSSPTFLPSVIPTSTPTPMPSVEPSPSSTPVASTVPTSTPTPVPSMVSSPTPTPVPSVVPSPTPTPVVNSIPVAYDNNLTTVKDTNLTIKLLGEDSDSNSLNYTVTTQPAYGILSGTAPNLIYTPNRNYVGEDGFKFRVNDGMSDSREATLSIIVKALDFNKAPIAVDDSVITKKNLELIIDVLSNDKDSDGTLDNTTVQIISAPTAGTATVVNGKINYRPKSNYSGKDNFTYRVKDNGGLLSNEATVSVIINNINSVNNRPIAEAQNLTIKKDTNLSIVLKGRDRDGDKLSYHIVQSPRYGSLSGLEPNIIYTPNSKYLGLDCFTFKVNDGKLDSQEARVSIVKSLEDKVVKANDTVTIEELSLYVSLENKRYKQPIVGKDKEGDLSKINISYEVKKMVDKSGYGLIYVTLKNGQSSDLESMKIFFLLDTSIEEESNTFFNEYGEYVAVRGEGSEDIYADYWQIDEPDYLNGHIVDNLNRGMLDNRNHIEISQPNDVAMALGFDINRLKSGEGITFIVRLSFDDIGGLSQIDRETGSRVYYDVIVEDSLIQTCMNK